MSQPIFRFAPSPNGLLHLGHAYSALLNADLAGRTGGRFLLRIDNIDGDRCRPEFEAAIIEDCRWLGLDFAEPVRRQSEHIAEYSAALNRLREIGLAYPAFMSRAEVARLVAAHERLGDPWPRDPDGSPLYPGDDRDIDPADAEERIAEGEPYAMRLDMEAAMRAVGPLSWRAFPSDDPNSVDEVAANPSSWGDVLLAGREIPASYHLAVVVDDAAQHATHVVRGLDLASATAVHRLLQVLLGLPHPVYCHHRLIRDETGRKLAKSDRDTGISSLRQRGLTVADIRDLVGLAPD